MPDQESRSASASLRVLEWIERYMADKALGPGDALPGELEICAEASASRSSVREALTVLKVLGIIRTRRKGGITIVRAPVVLELRHYFVERYEPRALRDEVMEFRAALEWGFGPLVMARVDSHTVRELRSVVDYVRQNPTIDAVGTSEIRFHTLLAQACGNRLYSIFSHIYPPIFRDIPQEAVRLSAAEHARWLREHGGMADALEAGDTERFLSLLREHTHVYMRFPKRRAK